jgi:hypothetical protein
MLSSQLLYRPLSGTQLQFEDKEVRQIQKYQKNIIRSQNGVFWIVYTIYTNKYVPLIILYPLQEGAMVMLNTKVSHSSAYHTTIALADLLWAPHLLHSKCCKDREQGLARKNCLADSGPIWKSFDMTRFTPVINFTWVGASTRSNWANLESSNGPADNQIRLSASKTHTDPGRDVRHSNSRRRPNRVL